MKETNFQKILVNSLRKCGAEVFNIHGHAMQVAGIPDLYIAHRIWTGWLELKCGNNKVTKLQANTLKKLVSNGVSAFILVGDKPNHRMIFRSYDEEIIGYLSFMSNDIDGIEFLNGIVRVVKEREAVGNG